MDAALLDTDTVSEILKQRSPTVAMRAADYLDEHGRFSFSEFTWFEVLRGLLEKKAVAQVNRFENFSDHSEIKLIDGAVLRQAANLWATARVFGNPHGDADLIIAATAQVHALTLITDNMKHFAWITGLELENWCAE